MSTAAARRSFGQFPIPRTDLIGRNAECAEARTQLLEDAVPLLTLTGPGGVGKTRLAVSIARDIAAHFADGVVWVDLAPLDGPGMVAESMIAALALTPGEAQTAVGRPKRLPPFSACPYATFSIVLTCWSDRT